MRIGVPVANRNRIETEGLIGLFVNTLVLRSTVSGALRFDELLASVGGFHGFNRAGQFHAGIFGEPGTPALALGEDDIERLEDVYGRTPGKPVSVG